MSMIFELIAQVADDDDNECQITYRNSLKNQPTFPPLPYAL